jgi:hypothetical protein
MFGAAGARGVRLLAHAVRLLSPGFVHDARSGCTQTRGTMPSVLDRSAQLNGDGHGWPMQPARRVPRSAAEPLNAA